MNNLYNMDGVASADHYLADQEYYVLKHGQHIRLKYAMYRQDMKIVKTIAHGGDAIVPDVTTIGNSDLDYDSMSVAMVLDPSFTGEIVKELVVNFTDSEIGAGFGILVSGYAFETPYENIVASGGEGPIPTPGIIGSMLEDIAFLKQAKTSYNGSIAVLLNGNAPKEFDGTGQAEQNKIVCEAHHVNVHTGQCNIIPSAGDFYEHDVKVTYDDKVLTRGEHYELGALRVGKIISTQSPSPIYGRITIKAAIVGTVVIDYRAVGGMATNSHYAALADAITSVSDRLQFGGIITESTLSKAPSFINLDKRVRALESQFGTYPKYQYSFSTTSSNLDWYTIGKVGYDDGGNIIKRGQFMMDIDIPSAGTSYSTILSFNIGATEGEQIHIETISSTGSPGSSRKLSKTDLDSLEKSLQMVRIIYIGDPNDPVSFKGGLLQIGHKSTVGAGFYPVITNRSHVDPGLELIAPDQAVTSAQNDNVPISVDNIWTSSNADHHVAEHVLQHDDGVILWQGAVSVNDMELSGVELNTFWDSDTMDLSAVEKISFFFRDRFTGTTIMAVNEHMCAGDYMSGSVIFHSLDMCALRYGIVAGSDGNFSMTVDADLGTHSKVNERFELHRVTLKF